LGGANRAQWKSARRLSRSAECRLDVGCQEVEVELVRIVGVERVKAEAFPPGSRALGECCHDDCSACRLLVELDGCGEHATGEGGPDPKAPVSVIDREPAEQQRRDGIGRTVATISGAADRSIPVSATLA
jgi:hypothetical protein